MFQIIKGDLLDADASFICHQVNCQNAMGAGIAKAIYEKWPMVKTEYHKFCTAVGCPEKLLGQVQVVPLSLSGMSVINVFGQLDFGRKRDVVYTDYDALKQAFATINKVCRGKTIAFPYGFGCGLAGGDWATVEKLMLQTLLDCEVKIYKKD